MPELPPLSLYIHIPWCERKCPYCDFNSHTFDNALPEALYVKKLEADLKSQAPLVHGRKLISIFIGGGTPSLFSVQAIARILAVAEQVIGFDPDIEITMEANPSSAEQGKFQGLRACGVNRLSIGVQSFDDTALKKLGRIHNPSDAKQAIRHAQKAGFNRINIDLMHGLSGQTQALAMSDLEQAIAFDVEHISWYQLTIEPNTEFYRFPPKLPDEDALSDIQDEGAERLAKHGYEQYEVSAYARNKAFAKHNLNYWQFGDYLAVGAGAHGKITTTDRGIIRFNNTRTPKDYLAREGDFRAATQVIDSDTALFEALLNGLRLRQGITLKALCNYTGASLISIKKILENVIEKKLITIKNQRVITTEIGYRHLNSLLILLVQNDE